MRWSDLLSRIVAWLRAGYPHGVPEQDFLPLLAMLGRRLSDEEVDQVVTELVAQGAVPADRVGAGVEITRLTHELPRESDLTRVRDRLHAAGWPVDDDWQPPVADAADTSGQPSGESESAPAQEIRGRYRRNLGDLADLLHEMCLRDRTVVATATDALLTADLPQSEAAIDIGREVHLLGAEAQREAMRLLTLQSPVAGDLRRVVTAVQLIGNLTRMAGLATHIAAAARRRHPEHMVPEPVRPLIAHLGSATIAITTTAAAVLRSGDPDTAATIDKQDDIVDDLHEQLLATVLGPAWDHGVTAAVDLTLLGRYYERYADNAVEVGRRTLFLATGRREPEDID